MPSPHVDDEKDKKAMVYKARKDRRRGDEKKGKRTREEKKKGELHLLGMSEEAYC